MPQHNHDEAPLVQRRKILLAGVEASQQGLISTFLVTMGWTCTVLRDLEDVPDILQRETFDALLIDLGHSVGRAEQVILRLKQIRPSLEDRILIMNSSAEDREMIELMERHNLVQVGALQQFWVTVQGFFSPTRSHELASRRMALARMTFDSFRYPLPAEGVRGLPGGPRQLAFQHQGATIDLSIEFVHGSSRVSLAGQILDAHRKGSTEGISVLLVGGTGTLARTATNEFGEFHFECESPKDANLEIRLGEESWVMVPLGILHGAGTLTPRSKQNC